MIKTLTLLTIILSISFIFSADPEPKPLPREVKVIIDTRNTDIQAAKQVYDKAILEANKKAISRMEMMVKSATQRGDLDGALANRKFIEDWNKDKDNASAGVAFGGVGPKGSGVAEATVGGKKELKDLIVGKWRNGDKVYDLLATGKVSNPWNEEWEWEQKKDQYILYRNTDKGKLIKFTLELQNEKLVGYEGTSTKQIEFCR